MNAKRKEIDAGAKKAVQRGNLFYKVTVKV